LRTRGRRRRRRRTYPVQVRHESRERSEELCGSAHFHHEMPTRWAHFAEINRLIVSPPHKRLDGLANLQYGSSGKGVSPTKAANSAARTQPHSRRAERPWQVWGMFGRYADGASEVELEGESSDGWSVRSARSCFSLSLGLIGETDGELYQGRHGALGLDYGSATSIRIGSVDIVGLWTRRTR
jgi:hypothetical protein